MRLMRMSPEERGARRTALALATAVALGSGTASAGEKTGHVLYTGRGGN